MFKTKEISKTSIRIWVCVFLMLQNLKLEASNIQQASTPTGPAGGDLTGTYPNPTLAALTTNGDLLARIGGVNTRLPLGGACSLVYAGASSPLYTGTSGLCWDAANGNLGVGKAPNSAVRLDVLGSGLVQVRISSSAGAAQLNLAGTTFGQVQSTVGNLFITSASDLVLRTSGGTGLAYLNATSVGIGPGNTSPTGTLSCFDATATTGSTNCSFRAGAGQSGNVLRVLNIAGTEVAGINNAGAYLTRNTVLSSPDATASTAGIALAFNASNSIDISQGGIIQWTNANNVSSTRDIGISRTGPGVAQINSGTANVYRGLELSYIQSRGTTFTASGCSTSSLVGGPTAGRFASGTTGTCTVTVTMGNSATATNGWSCFASNRTTANQFRQTAATTTTATFEGTTVSGDVISFGCIGN